MHGRKIYFLLRSYYSDVGFYGVYSDVKRLLEDYYKILAEEKMNCLEHITIFEFEEDTLAGKFESFLGEDEKTFYESIKEISIEELEKLYNN